MADIDWLHIHKLTTKKQLLSSSYFSRKKTTGVCQQISSVLMSGLCCSQRLCTAWAQRPSLALFTQCLRIISGAMVRQFSANDDSHRAKHLVSVGRADGCGDLFSSQTLGELKFFASDRCCFSGRNVPKRTDRRTDTYSCSVFFLTCVAEDSYSYNVTFVLSCNVALWDISLLSEGPV